MDAGSLLDFKKKLSAFITGQSIPEYYLWLWKSLELKFLRGCQNILDNIILCVPCTLPYAFAVGGRILRKTKSLGRGLHLTTSPIQVKKPPLHCSDVERKTLLLCQLIPLLCLCPLPGLCCISKRSFSIILLCL